jgi:hypothetical protein
MTFPFNMKVFIQITMITCIIVYSSIYLKGIKKGTVKPILATWIFLSAATILSFITDFAESGTSGMLANSFNIIDTIATVFIFSFVLSRKDTRKKFSTFEKVCLGAVILIFLMWLISGLNILAHLAIQFILVVAYLPTFVHLWKSTQNTESLGMWSFDCLASALGTIEPVRVMAFLPLVYGIRSILSTIGVIALILRIKYRGNKKGLA